MLNDIKNIDTLLNNLAAPVIVTLKTTGEIVYANKYVRNQYKVEPSELIGKNIKEFYVSDNQKEQILNEYSLSEEHLENLEQTFIDIHGNEFSGLLSLTEVTYNNQECWLGIVTDITKQKLQQKQIEQLLSEHKEYIKVIERTTMLFKTDITGLITYANDSFCEAMGYDLIELLDVNYQTLIHPDMSRALLQESVTQLKQNKIWQGKIKYITKDGEQLFSRVSTIPVYDVFHECTSGYVCINSVITDEEMEKRKFKKEVMKSLQKYKKMEIEYQVKILEMEEEINSYKIQSYLPNKNLSEIDQLKDQIDYLESELRQKVQKEREVIQKARNHLINSSEKIKQLSSDKNTITRKLIKTKESYDEVKQMLTKITVERQEDQKTILNLRDVIDHLESKIRLLVGEESRYNRR